MRRAAHHAYCAPAHCASSRTLLSRPVPRKSISRYRSPLVSIHAHVMSMRALAVRLPRAPFSLSQSVSARSQGLSESANELISVMQRDTDLRRLVTDNEGEERIADVENHVSALLNVRIAAIIAVDLIFCIVQHEQVQAAEDFLVHMCNATSWRISPRAFLGVFRSMVRSDPKRTPNLILLA